MKVINDIILNQSNQSSLDLGTTNDVILIQSDNEVGLKSTDNATYESALSCSQFGTPAAEMISQDLGSTFSRVQVLSTGTLYIESGDGFNLNQIQMTPLITTITTPTTLYSAQQNGDLEIRADGTLNLYADYQGNQTNIFADSTTAKLFATDGVNNGFIEVKSGTVSITTPTTYYLADWNGNVTISADMQLSLITQGAGTLVAYDDDADAGANGLATGNLYQTTGLGASPLDVAGIVMIKQ